MDDDIDIGTRLKKLRAEKSISQRQLAIKAKVSNAAISLIENNKSNPSLGMLKKILDSVPISISDFFAMDIQIETKVVFRKHELTEIGAGAISYLQVGKNLQNNQLQMMLERYKPGADTGQNMLTHESEESGIILEGRLEVTVGDEVYYLNSGDAYLFNSTIPHRFKNPDAIDCVLITACTPPSF